MMLYGELLYYLTHLCVLDNNDDDVWWTADIT